MKFRPVAILIAFLILLGSSGKSIAITLGLPDISFDSSQGSGLNLFTPTQGVQFSGTTGYLGVSARALGITYDGVTTTPFANGTLDYQAQLINSFSNPFTVTGNFGSLHTGFPDLVLADGGTTLLTGTFDGLSLTGIVGSNLGLGTATFLVTGGSLAPYFASQYGGLVDLTFNITPGYTTSTFSSGSAFEGSVKGDLAPVPSPSSTLLMGTALVTLLLVSVRKHEQE